MMLMMRTNFPKGITGDDASCVTLIIDKWVIGDWEQEAFACFAMFVLAFVHEFLIHVRREMKKRNSSVFEEDELSLLLNRRYETAALLSRFFSTESLSPATNTTHRTVTATRRLGDGVRSRTAACTQSSSRSAIC
jgi:hypothetical protein